MVLYFTGTGNSRYIAEKIAKETEDRIININDKIKQKDNSFIKTDGRLIFVVPNFSKKIFLYCRNLLNYDIIFV